MIPGAVPLEYYRELALEVVGEYEERVRLDELADPDEADYLVGPFQPASTSWRIFDHAGHPHYDTKAFNNDELAMATALDKFGSYVWVRNKDRSGYGIPLPIKSGSSSTFYPDFLWWVKDTVWAIDPTGKFILNEKLRTKLIMVPEPLKIALVTRGKLNESFNQVGEDGWTLARYRHGNLRPETFDNLSALLKQLEEESVTKPYPQAEAK